jgi:hypothetical protein
VNTTTARGAQSESAARIRLNKVELSPPRTLIMRAAHTNPAAHRTDLVELYDGRD